MLIFIVFPQAVRERTHTHLCARTHNLIYRLLPFPTPRVPLYVSFVLPVMYCTRLMFVVPVSGAIETRHLLFSLPVVWWF